MTRRFKTIDQEKPLDQTLTLRDVLPPDHLARFLVRVISLLDVSPIYAKYAEAIPAAIGKPQAAALDNGCWSPTTVEALATQGIEPYIATGRDSHHRSWQERFAQEPEPPPQDASPIVQMAYKLKTEIGIETVISSPTGC
jgi:hypothetical protein